MKKAATKPPARASRPSARNGQNVSVTQQAEPGKIEFSSYEEGMGFVTGIAKYPNTNGMGAFSIRVSGQRTAIDDYAAQALIMKMEFVPLEQVNQDAVQEDRRRAREFWRAQWQERLYRLERIVADADAPLLAEPDRIWRIARDQERAELNQHSGFNPKTDRLIQIQPTDGLEKGKAYLVSFYIDPPSVCPDHPDIYATTIVRGYDGSTYFSAWVSGANISPWYVAASSAYGNIYVYAANGVCPATYDISGSYTVILT